MHDEDRSPFQIDPEQLDKELLAQPRLSRDAGRREAEARHEHAQKKAKFEVVAARLRLAIRGTPGRYSLRDKPNAEEVEAATTIQPEYQAALQALNEAKFELDVAAAETIAYLDRRKAIEGLIELMQLDWWAEKEVRPRTPRSREDADLMRRRASRSTDD